MTEQGKATVPDPEERRLGEMLALVGPASEAGLLRSLISDLRATREKLIAALEERDARRLRDQTHVLASLADTFGAPALSAAAQALQAQSLEGDEAPLGAVVIAETEGLIARLSRRLERTLP